MVNWSLDDGDSLSIQPPRRRRNSQLKAQRQEINQKSDPRRLSNGKVRKIINGEVVYVRVRRVVKTQS